MIEFADCECDNTHEQNKTVCRACWNKGLRYDTAWWRNGSNTNISTWDEFKEWIESGEAEEEDVVVTDQRRGVIVVGPATFFELNDAIYYHPTDGALDDKLEGEQIDLATAQSIARNARSR